MKLNKPKAEIIAIGSEFLHGQRTESNSLFLAEGLAQCGVEVYWKTQVGDHLASIAAVVKTGVQRADVVVITGGLGSTVDDCTREAIAAVTNCPLRRRNSVLHSLKTRYANYGRTMSPVLARQASFPTGAEMLNNPVGSAPGFLLEWKQSVIIVLPGVSKEAKAMFDAAVTPHLATRLGQSNILIQRKFSTVGLTELQIDERLQPILKPFPSIELTLLASTQGVSVVLRTWSLTQNLQMSAKEKEEMEQLLPTIQKTLGKSVYGIGEETMEAVVGELLMNHSQTLSVAESCTGGLIGHRLTQVPGSSSYFDRSFVCYSNQAKQDLLGVSATLLRRHGAVSAPVARTMAEGARKNSQTDIGLSVTGIAGPGGGSVRKPVGTVFIGIDGPKGSLTKKFKFPGDRQDVKMRTSQAGLNLVRLYLMEGASQ